MHILITGANGFIGRALADRLQQDEHLEEQAIARLTLIDQIFDDSSSIAPFVQRREGDLTDSNWLATELTEEPIDVIFHLASIPGGIAENNYELARTVNIDATLQLLEAGKAQVETVGRAPIFVFASSIAVFGDMPTKVDDDTTLKPNMTYGAQKVVGEVMVEEFSRRGWIDGRSLRLPGVLARPPVHTGQLSAFLSNIIRELAAGRSFVCPTHPEASTWASSLPCVIQNLIHGATLSKGQLQKRRTYTLPTSHFLMKELVKAIAQVYGTPAETLVQYQPNEQIETFFARFPKLETPAATKAGFCRDTDLTTLVKNAINLEENSIG